MRFMDFNHFFCDGRVIHPGQIAKVAFLLFGERQARASMASNK
jgi:hypothetical protein